MSVKVRAGGYTTWFTDGIHALRKEKKKKDFLRQKERNVG